MGAGPAVVSGERGGWVHLLDPDRKFHNNWRSEIFIKNIIKGYHD